MKNYVKKEVDTVGNVFYYNSNGNYHRLDGPAIEHANGAKEWWVDGKRHREDGPAIEMMIEGGKYWYINCKLHRLDGPAIQYNNKGKYWWETNEWRLNDIFYYKTQHNRMVLFFILEPRKIDLSPTENVD
jgi:hypothetical protein